MQGDVKKLIDDIQAFRPTLFAAVPRVLERVYKGINDQVPGRACMPCLQLQADNALACMP